MAQKDQLVVGTEPEKVTPKYTSQQTLQYKTFIKRTMVEALQDGFSPYVDATLKKTKIDIDYATDKADFPTIIIKWYGKTLKNAGVGHIEWFENPKVPGEYIPYHHTFYQGDVSFEIYGLSSVDRDKVTDALVEVVQMGTVGVSGASFQERIYDTIGKSPYSEWHFFSLDTDLLDEFGETQEIAPWIPEDTLVYKGEYRIPIMGEFYSKTPKELSGGLVTEVDFYPWDETDPVNTPPPEDFPEEIIPPEDYIKVTRH